MPIFATIFKLMKRYKILSGLVLASLLFVGFYLPFRSEKKDKVIMELVYNALSNYHFNPQAVNDDFSAEAFQEYLESIDIGKRLITQQDVDRMVSYRNQLDDALKTGDMEFFELSYKIIEERIVQTEKMCMDLLNKPFDFSKKEEFESDPEKVSFAKNDKDLQDRWRKYLKYRVMGRIYDRQQEQEKALEEKDTSMTQKTFAELEIEGRERERELHEEWFKNLKDFDRLDWMGIFVNSLTTLYDPHTEYFPPKQQESFEIEMSGQFEGIGAQLNAKGDYIVIEKIITGSACYRQGELEVGDKILKVGQGEEEPIDVVGMSVRKIITYIRGKKGTEVRLTVRKLDGTKKVIPIIRDVVELESTFARSAVVEENGLKIGYIKLPRFYVDFYNQGNRNCADDVRKELEKLKAEGISGVVLDLRNNGGGSLPGVVDMVGLFIEKGPVVQVKSSGGTTQVLSDDAPDVVWDGPLVVLVNQFSASASEIFAAAIQDYNRGVVMGSTHTFGKGTVQNVMDMDRAVGFSMSDVKPLGALKLTIQKFYRINGGTTQLNGVSSDVILPDSYSYIEFGEREQKHALEYDEIAPANYRPFATGAYKKAIEHARSRVATNPKFVSIDAYAKELKEKRDLTKTPLEWNAFNAFMKAEDAESEGYKDLFQADEPIGVAFLTGQADEFGEDESKKSEYERWHKALQKDLYLREAHALISDVLKN